MQTKTTFFGALLFMLFLQTMAASPVLAGADAGLDKTVNEGDTVYLDGLGSAPEDDDDDDEDKIQSYLWEQVEVEGSPVIIIGADQAVARFTAPQVSKKTRLTFQLTVRFASGSTDTDRTKVFVLDVEANGPPTADAGPDQTVPEKTTVTLDGSNSSDPDDGIESYLWKQTKDRQLVYLMLRRFNPPFLPRL